MRLHSVVPLGGGDPVPLIEVEQASDLDALVANMESCRYYDAAYFQDHSGYKARAHVAHFWLVGELLRRLQPRRAFELGCGRGDLLSILARGGCEVLGLDPSADAVAAAWPDVKTRLRRGTLEQVGPELEARGERFDLLLGLDVWEHLHPRALPRAVEQLTALATDDALLFAVIPAFGRDRSFGEQFPLEFEQNRAAFDARQPFRFLTAERTAPPIPVAGHLIWAHAEWWEAQFVAHGWRRVVALEPLLRGFDAFLPHSVRSAFLFGRDHPAARRRVEALARAPLARQVRLSLARALAAVAAEDPEELARRWIIPRLPAGLRRTLREVRARVRALVPG